MLALYTSFLTTLFFTTLLGLLKSTGIGAKVSISKLYTLDFRLNKLTLLANFYVSTRVPFFK